MTLCLSDDASIVRAMKRARHGAIDFHAARLPARLTTAAGYAGVEIGRTDPEVVVVATTIDGDSSDRVGVVYRLSIAGHAWVPDVAFDHDCESLSAATTDAGEPDAVRVSEEAAAAAAAALGLLAPHRVLVIAGGAAATERIAGAAATLGQRLLARYRSAAALADGPAHVTETVRMGGALAERLRLTATQRSRFLTAARSAAVRGGEVPSPVRDEEPDRPRTKEEAKRRLAELEERLREWQRGEP